jgi:hypothetical protein
MKYLFIVCYILTLVSAEFVKKPLTPALTLDCWSCAAEAKKDLKNKPFKICNYGGR